MVVCTPADSKARVGDASGRPEKRLGDSNEDIGGEVTCREPRSGQLDRASAAGTYMQQACIVQQLSLVAVCSHSLLQGQVSKEIEACCLNSLCYKGDTPGWLSFGARILECRKKKFFCTFCLMGT